MSLGDTIGRKLRDAFSPEILEVLNESHLHAGHHHLHDGREERFDGEGETHFRVVLVAEAFSGRSRVERHRAVNEILKDELRAGLHALAIEARAPGEPARRTR